MIPYQLQLNDQQYQQDATALARATAVGGRLDDALMDDDDSHLPQSNYGPERANARALSRGQLLALEAPPGKRRRISAATEVAIGCPSRHPDAWTVTGVLHLARFKPTSAHPARLLLRP